MNIKLKSPDKEIVYQAFHNEIWTMKIYPMSCLEHREKAICSVYESAKGPIEVNLTVCCENFGNKITSECRKEIELREKFWSK